MMVSKNDVVDFAAAAAKVETVLDNSPPRDTVPIDGLSATFSMLSEEVTDLIWAARLELIGRVEGDACTEVDRALEVLGEDIDDLINGARKQVTA